MPDMGIGIPAHLEKIEREARFLRRNSTGSFGIQIAKSKVSSRYLSHPKGSCHDACKGTEHDDQTTKARTSQGVHQLLGIIHWMVQLAHQTKEAG